MREQGSVLLATVLAMMLLLLLGGVLTRLMATELEISEKFSDGIAAYYAAEAGVKRALVEIDNHATEIKFTEFLYNSNYYVAINNGSTKQEKVITAVGKKNGAVRKAIATVILAKEPYYACYSGASMILSTRVIGRVGLSGTDITINEGGSIIDLAGNAAQPETKVSNFQLPLVKASFNEKNYEYARRLSNVLDGGTYQLKGNYYVDGDFALKDAAITVPEHSSATIFVKGNVELTGSIGSNVTIISTEMVMLQGTGGSIERVMRVYANKGIQVSKPIEGHVLLMSKGDISVNASIHGVVISRGNAFIESPVEGSVLADKMLMQSGSGEIKYDEHIFSSLGLTRPKVMAWEY